MVAVAEQTVTEVYSDWAVTYRIIPLTAGVEIHIYDESKQAVLVFNGSSETEFAWTDESAAMFGNIDGANAVELLGLIARLNHKIEADMLAVRHAHRDAPQPDWDCLTLDGEPALEMSLDGMVYRTTAQDDEGNRYIVTWIPGTNGDCDWDNPSRMLAI